MKLTSSVVVACAFSAVGLFTAASVSAQVTLLGSGVVPNAVSADGRVVVGQDANFPGRAFRWTAAGGLYEIGADPDFPTTSSALGVSADGTWVVGGSTGGAFRWHGTGTFESIVNQPPPVTGGTATGVSADGAAVCGWSGFEFQGPMTPWYWTQSGGQVTIPIAGAKAAGISRDGAVVVGYTQFGNDRGFTWSASGGVRILNSADGVSETSANAINFDGTIVVGNSGPIDAPTIWMNGVPTALPVPANWTLGFVPTCLDDEASVVAGFGGPAGANQAAIWTPARGTELFATYLASFGISFPVGFSPELINGVSSDGLTFTGRCVNPGVSREGFVVTIPAPGGMMIAALAISFATKRRVRSAGAPPDRGNFAIVRE